MQSENCSRLLQEQIHKIHQNELNCGMDESSNRICWYLFFFWLKIHIKKSHMRDVPECDYMFLKAAQKKNLNSFLKKRLLQRDFHLKSCHIVIYITKNYILHLKYRSWINGFLGRARYHSRHRAAVVNNQPSCVGSSFTQ